MPVLAVIEGGQDASVFEIESSPCVIGKAPRADVHLLSEYISRLHAEIAEVDGDWRVRDLESRNGTWLNGKQIDKDGVWLTDGDTIELARGKAVLQFRSGSSTITLVDFRDDEPVLSVDDGKREIHRRGQLVDPGLSNKEFNVVSALYQNRERVLSRDEVREAGWPEREQFDVSDNDVDQIIHRIRLRIEDDPKSPEILVTVRGFGFRILID